MFNPDRLTLARLRAGFSKAQLAELMGLSTRTITNYELGNQNPSKEIVIKLAETLKFLPDFFYLQHAPSINMEERDKISFRARSKITRGQTDTAVASLSRCGHPPMDAAEAEFTCHEFARFGAIRRYARNSG